MSTVYFIQAGRSGPVKVGVSCDLQKRLEAIQTHNSALIHVLGEIPGSYELEALLHEWLALDQVRGEWFKPDVAGAILERLRGKDAAGAVELVSGLIDERAKLRARFRAEVSRAVQAAFHRFVGPLGVTGAANSLGITGQGLRYILRGRSAPTLIVVAALLSIDPTAMDEVFALADKQRDALRQLHKVSGDWLQVCADIRRPRDVAA
jgi:hypothetical protein